MYLPTLSYRQENRNDFGSNLNKTLVNDSERFSKLKQINFFATPVKKEAQRVEKFDKTKILPPDYYVLKKSFNSAKIFDKKAATNNERKTINQNNVQDRLLLIKRKHLDRQLDYSQGQIKRERSIILEQFLETKAANMQFMRQKALPDVEKLSMEDKMLYKSKYPFLVPEETVLPRLTKSSESQYPPVQSANNTINTTEQINNANKSTSQKFVEQQRKYLPSYKRKKDVLRNAASADIDHFIEKGKRKHEQNRTVCSKFKNHVLAKYRAEYFSNNKYLLKEFPDLNDLLHPADEHLISIEKAKNQALNKGRKSE